jgi:hypothetical protein
MDLKQVAKDTSKTTISYLTYQAVRTVLAQLSETNPPLALWLHRFSSTDKIQDGEAYIQRLFQEKQDLAFRILTVRSTLAQEVVDFARNGSHWNSTSQCGTPPSVSRANDATGSIQP